MAEQFENFTDDKTMYSGNEGTVMHQGVAVTPDVIKDPGARAAAEQQVAAEDAQRLAGVVAKVGPMASGAVLGGHPNQRQG